jgi:uncharacterized small protein (DUF1192 family)
MDADDLLPKRPDSPLALLAREDLDRLSRDELEQRIAILKAEIARTETRLADASAFRAAADSLFRG